MTLKLLRRLEGRIDALVDRQRNLEHECAGLRRQVAGLLKERERTADRLDRVLAELAQLEATGEGDDA